MFEKHGHRGNPAEVAAQTRRLCVNVGAIRGGADCDPENTIYAYCFSSLECNGRSVASRW